MIDFDWYRSFLAVYRAGTVSGAAESRFLTQPAVSQHLQALEAICGGPLFTRTPRRMLPTERGKALYTQIALSLDKLEQVSQGLRQTEPLQSLVRLGAPLEYFYEKALPQLLAVPYRYNVSFGPTQSLLEQLERDELDVVIASQRLAGKDIEYQRLYEEQFYLVGSTDLALPQSGLEKWLAEQKWLSYGPELPIIRRFWQQTFGHRPDFTPALIIPHLPSLQKAVELGAGLSVLPGYIVQAGLEAGRLKVLWEPPQPVTNEIWLASRKVNRTRLEIKRLTELLAVEE